MNPTCPGLTRSPCTLYLLDLHLRGNYSLQGRRQNSPIPNLAFSDQSRSCICRRIIRLDTISRPKQTCCHLQGQPIASRRDSRNHRKKNSHKLGMHNSQKNSELPSSLRYPKEEGTTKPPPLHLHPFHPQCPVHATGNRSNKLAMGNPGQPDAARVPVKPLFCHSLSSGMEIFVGAAIGANCGVLAASASVSPAGARATADATGCAGSPSGAAPVLIWTATATGQSAAFLATGVPWLLQCSAYIFLYRTDRSRISFGL